MDSGYQPERVQLLSQRTREAIEELTAIASTDPAASEAMRTVRLARTNLEDQWMPALRDIERSDALVRWRAGRTSIAIPSEHRRRLLRRLDLLERKALTADADRRAQTDPTGGPTTAALAALARRLAFWVAHDDRFADELVELSVSNMLVGRLLGEARFPSSFSSRVVRRMAVPNGPDSGVDHDRYAASLSTALASMTDDPAACLDLLLDQPTAFALASWPALDTAMLADFVDSGLHVAVDTDPERLADGYTVLRLLTRAANGPLDEGMSAGMALGVAASLAGYIDTLAPAIRQEGMTPVVIRAVDPQLELGSYDGLVDLFGALLRVPEAQAALGTVLSAYAFETFERVGGDAGTRPEVSHLAGFADLVGDANRTEQAELVMTAAVDEARRRQLGGLIGFGAGAMLSAGGAGSVTRAIVGHAIRMATDWRARPEPEQIEDVQVPAHTYDLITVAAVTVAASHPSMREVGAVRDVTPAQWSEARRHLAIIEQVDDPHDRMRAVGDLDHWIETGVPALSAYLVEIRKLPGMDELTEGRNAVGPD